MQGIGQSWRLPGRSHNIPQAVRDSFCERAKLPLFYTDAGLQVVARIRVPGNHVLLITKIQIEPFITNVDESEIYTVSDIQFWQTMCEAPKPDPWWRWVLLASTYSGATTLPLVGLPNTGDIWVSPAPAPPWIRTDSYLWPYFHRMLEGGAEETGFVSSFAFGREAIPIPGPKWVFLMGVWDQHSLSGSPCPFRLAQTWGSLEGVIYHQDDVPVDRPLDGLL